MSDKSELSQLKLEIRKLREQNQRLQSALMGKKPGLSDDAVDGIVATTLIGVIVIGVVFWLGSMPS